MNPSEGTFAAVFLSALIIKRRRRLRKVKRIWEKPWMLRRGASRILDYGIVKSGPENSMTQWGELLGLQASDLEELKHWIGPAVYRQDTTMRAAISVKRRLLVTLRFLATGDSYSVLRCISRLSNSTISHAIPEVCQAISNALMQRAIMKNPETGEDWKPIIQSFQNELNFPRCIGVLDGRHITMQSKSATHCPNHRDNSFIIMALIDTQHKFITIKVIKNENQSADEAFLASGMLQYLEQFCITTPPESLNGHYKPVPYVILSNESFSLRSFVLKPYIENPENLDTSQKIFNYHINRVRNLSENTFGVLPCIFQVLRKPLLLLPEKVDNLVTAICCLYNYLMSKDPMRISPKMFDTDNSITCAIDPGTWRQEEKPQNNIMYLKNIIDDSSSAGEDVRNEFKKFFVNCSDKTF